MAAALVPKMRGMQVSPQRPSSESPTSCNDPQPALFLVPEVGRFVCCAGSLRRRGVSHARGCVQVGEHHRPRLYYLKHVRLIRVASHPPPTVRRLRLAHCASKLISTLRILRVALVWHCTTGGSPQDSRRSSMEEGSSTRMGTGWRSLASPTKQMESDPSSDYSRPRVPRTARVSASRGGNLHTEQSWCGQMGASKLIACTPMHLMFCHQS